VNYFPETSISEINQAAGRSGPQPGYLTDTIFLNEIDPRHRGTEIEILSLAFYNSKDRRLLWSIFERSGQMNSKDSFFILFSRQSGTLALLLISLESKTIEHVPVFDQSHPLDLRARTKLTGALFQGFKGALFGEAFTFQREPRPVSVALLVEAPQGVNLSKRFRFRAESFPPATRAELRKVSRQSSPPNSVGRIHPPAEAVSGQRNASTQDVQLKIDNRPLITETRAEPHSEILKASDALQPDANARMDQTIERILSEAAPLTSQTREAFEVFLTQGAAPVINRSELRIAAINELPVRKATLLYPGAIREVGSAAKHIVEAIGEDQPVIFFADLKFVDQSKIEKLIHGLPGAENVHFVFTREHAEHLLVELGIKSVYSMGMRGIDDNNAERLERMLFEDHKVDQVIYREVSNRREILDIFHIAEDLGRAWAYRLMALKSV